MNDTRMPDWRKKLFLYPVCVFEDRYGGCYSGGPWVAFSESRGSRRQLGEMEGGDTVAMCFVLPEWAAVGDTPNDAVDNLYEKIGLAEFPEYASQ